MLVGSFKYAAPRYYSLCATDLQRPKFILISYSKASLSLVKMDQEPLIDDAQSLKLATDHESIQSFHGS